MNTFSLPAPAKLNLFLHVTGQRADGYHDIQTLFQLLDYGDTLTFTPNADSVIRVHLESALPSSGAVNISSSDNLVTRAAELLQAACRQHQPIMQFTGVDIVLQKRIPLGSGLGGGSSDAATTLYALNILWDCRLSEDALAEIGSTIGADVPLFVYAKNAWGEGRGDQLTGVSLPPQWYAVLVPPVKILSAEIFHVPELMCDCSEVTFQDYTEDQCINVFQEVVTQRYPAVANTLEWLEDYGAARLSGSGSSVFASFDTRAEAAEVIAKKPSELFGFVAEGMNYSPLLDRLKALSKG